MNAVCLECGRIFDMGDVDERAEWYYGHDCEVGVSFTHPVLGTIIGYASLEEYNDAMFAWELAQP